MALNIRGAVSNFLADVVAGLMGTNGIVVSPEATRARAGFQAGIAEVDPGTVTGARLLRELDASFDFRLRTGLDTVLWQDVFGYANINANAYSVTTSTMTITAANGLLNLNAGAAVATGNHVVLRTWRAFPLISSAPTYVYFPAIAANQSAINAQCDIGLGFALTTAAPTDGVFFRWALDGTLRGVINNNGVEQTTPALTPVTDTERGEYLICINDETAEFWINGVLRATLEAPSTWAGHGVVRSAALPVLARLFNSGTASAAKQVSLGEIHVTQGDLNMERLWGTQMVGMELGAYQSPPGAAASQTANYANSAAPASATLSNTTAGYTTLGGQFQFAAVAGAETDYALFAYQVPAGSVSQPGKNLMVRGIWIDTFNMGAAVATTPTLLQWAVATGSSAVSLATADSLTAAGKAPRRTLLGSQSFPVGAAIGANADRRISENFDVPLLCPPGSFFHIIVKMPVGTATASQIIRGVCGVNGYFE